MFWTCKDRAKKYTKNIFFNNFINKRSSLQMSIKNRCHSERSEEPHMNKAETLNDSQIKSNWQKPLRFLTALRYIRNDSRIKKEKKGSWRRRRQHTLPQRQSKTVVIPNEVKNFVWMYRDYILFLIKPFSLISSLHSGFTVFIKSSFFFRLQFFSSFSRSIASLI